MNHGNCMREWGGVQEREWKELVELEMGMRLGP
jgi:hypothetical protein